MEKRPYSAPVGECIELVQEEALLTGSNRADEGYDPDNDLGDI